MQKMVEPCTEEKTKKKFFLKFQSNKALMMTWMVLGWPDGCFKSCKVGMVLCFSIAVQGKRDALELSRVILTAVLGMAGIGEEKSARLMGMYVVRSGSGRLAEKAVGPDSFQRMGAVRVDCPSCGRWLLRVHCGLHWFIIFVFQKKVENDSYVLSCANET